MKPLAHSGADALILIAVACAAACGCGATSGSLSSDRESADAAVEVDPLLGTWHYAGSVPDLVDITLTVQSDQILKFDEFVAPAVGPVGLSNGETCRTSFSFLATYVTAESETESSLTWELQQGVRNVISGCQDSARNNTGTAMTVEDLDYYINEDIVFPKTITYAASANSLVLNPNVTDKVGLMRQTAFSRVQPSDP